MVLAQKSLNADWVDVNPFTEPSARNPNSHDNPHPFNRVPFFHHGCVELFETTAICQYLDDEFPTAGELQPTTTLERARMRQVISITDQYAYPALVRGVFENVIVVPKWGLPPNPAGLREAINESNRVLTALSDLVAGPGGMVANQPTLADAQLAPMMAYFTQAPQGAELLAAFPPLQHWWASWRNHPCLVATDPGEMPAGAAN